MNTLKMLGANVPSGNQTLYQIINGLGLITNLKLCLDAGDSASYNPSVQTDKWLDTSGGGFDFFRGSSTSGDAAEPTFNGSAGGVSSSNYWSFDGADYFSYDSTIETWMQSLSRNNAIWSCVAVFYNGTNTGTKDIFSTRGSLQGSGIDLRITTSNTIAITIGNGTSTANEFGGVSLSVPTNAWSFFGIGWNETISLDGAFYRFNTTTGTTNGIYGAPSSSGESPMAIASRPVLFNTPFLTGDRLACLAIWQGTRLTAANLTAIYNGIKDRFGL